MTWWMWALGSTIFWGLFYLFVGRLAPFLTPVSMYWLPNIVLVAMLPFTYKTIAADYTKLYYGSMDIKIIAGVTAGLSIVASIMFYKALGMHNATHASLIQISYPLFTGLFAYLLFQDNYFTPSTVLGGLLIMVGSGLIVYNN